MHTIHLVRRKYWDKGKIDKMVEWRLTPMFVGIQMYQVWKNCKRLACFRFQIKD